MIKYFNSFTLMGKILIILDCICIILALVMQKYYALPYALLGIVSVSVSYKK